MSEAAGAELPSRGHELLIVQVAFMSVAGVATVIRAYVKAFLVKRVTWDDYLIFAAMAVYLVYGALAIDGVANGATGKPASKVHSVDDAARSLRAWYLCETLYAPITLAIRASVCIVLLRIATKKVHRWIIWINFGVIASVSVMFCFVLAFQCSPPSYFWRQVYGIEGGCMNKAIVTNAVYVHSAFSAVSDWCLGLLPIALLWGVSINMRTKAIIAVLLSLGMIAGVVLIVRMPYVTHLKPSLEFLYVSVDVAIWSVMEPALGIIAACVATYRPLFKNWGFGWGTSRSSGATSSNVASRRRTGHWRLSSPREGDGRGDGEDFDESYILGEDHASSELKISKTVEVQITSQPSLVYEAREHGSKAPMY